MSKFLKYPNLIDKDRHEKAMKFLNNFSEKYEKGNLDRGMENLQFNRDCLTSEEKNHLEHLLSCR